MDRPRLLFLHNTDASFVRIDQEILGEMFDVDPIDCSNGASTFEILRGLRRTEYSFSWFALGYATRAVMLGKLLRRPSVVVAGGYDVIAMPEIGYGAARTARGRLRARLALRATRLLTFSEWSRTRIQELSGRKAELLHLGVDTDTFSPAREKEDLVVTIGNVSALNIRRKGLETFVRAAARLDGVRCVVAGRLVDAAAEALKRSAPSNVEFPGRLEDADLRDLLGRAKVYVQVSYNEGFGLAVAEGMAAGAVPVVTRRGSLPEVAGDVGHYVEFGNPEATADTIQRALASGLSAQAREHVVSRFPLSRRRAGLRRVLQELTGA